MTEEIIKAGGTEVASLSSQAEKKEQSELYSLFQNCPIPAEFILPNLGLFLKRQVLSRILMFNEIYKKIINLHGIVCEFGTLFGTNMALFESFRGMYEPYNFNRKLVAFDTFEGFPEIHEKDGKSVIVKKGAYATSKHYEEYLEKIMLYHESNSPISHIKKFELIKGDATVTVKQYLKDNPETIIAFAYFDLDIYLPTKACLEAILPHLAKGAIIGFDELNFHSFPGETEAFQEVLGINNYRIHKDVNNSTASYIIFE
jgi:hypothetical protein